MIRRAIVFMLLIMTLVSAAPQGARAQTNDSRLAELDLPELTIQVTEDRFILPGSVASGRTLVTIENVSEESRHSFLVRVPDDWTVGELLAPPESPDLPPAWLFESTFPGYASEVEPGETMMTVIDLSPGMYVLVDDFSAIFVVDPADDAAPVAPSPIAADGTIDLFDFGFTVPDGLAGGDYIWEVTNSGPQPHELLLTRSTVADVTADQVMTAAMSEEENADGFSFSDLQPVGGVGWLSPGATAWTEVTLEPGTYVALCFVYDPEAGMPHAFEGMISVFTVS